ncbi:hypothetical protein HK407_07g12250, partial [Ordospora pajunii]|uniref:uncharacterized protein n=1 Tax=Ordospora pajunii TaxID=3039483 RepID=UPI0029527369
PTDANTGYLDVQQRIDKVWRVYGVGGVYDLLLDMSDEERKKVLKQLGCEHKIDVLIYGNTKKKDVRMNGRKDRLNVNKIADMLLGVRDKSQVASMVDCISTNHGYEYLANILLSIDDDNDLGNMISGLKEWPEIIAKILNGADDVDELNRLLNGVSSGIGKEYMEALLAKIEINENIVNELINKPENEQNDILRRINNTQLADKIKKGLQQKPIAVKVVQSVQSIRRESSREVFNMYENVLNNIHKILIIRDYVKLEKYKAYMQEVMHILTIVYGLIVSKELKDSSYDIQTNELNGVVLKWNIIRIVQTINGMISEVNQSMKDTDILKGKVDSMNKKLREMICDMILDTRKMDEYSNEYLCGLLSIIDQMISYAKDIKEKYKDVYNEVVKLCNKIKSNIYIYLMERIGMFSAVNLIAREIDKAANDLLSLSGNKYAKGSKDKNKSRSDQSKSADEMLNEMTPDEWERIVYTVVKKICKEKIYIHYELSNEEWDKNIEKIIKGLPYLGEMIKNSESNALNNGAEKNYSVKNALMILILIILTSIYNDLINRMIKYNKIMPASELSKRNMMIESNVCKLETV